MAVKKYLSKKGFSCKYLWFNYSSSIALSLVAIAIGWLLFNRRRPADEYMYRIRALAILWNLFSALDYSLYIFFNVILRLKTTQVLISDRYVYDVIIRLAFLHAKSERLNKFLLLLAPAPHLIFFFDAPEQLSLSRKKEGSLDFYRTQRALYVQNFERLNLEYVYIKTDDSFCDTLRKVLKYVNLTLHNNL